ncbi:MAG TPA: LytTR family DNA-binding domain-containing protein [Blastocatellia bacterium]|nr:LytTR family DNA-binding domain-containing protein [Blastocatellia bacterium]
MPQPFRAIIVDDERLARKELRSLLAEHAGVEVVGEADSVARAVEIIRAEGPDVVFLDIQMPGETGFTLLEKIEPAFKIIFVTAYDAYAIRAFEVNALDYLLKPINPERLAHAIERLREGAPARPVGAHKLEYEDRLFLEVDERSRFVKVSAIEFISAAGDYSEIFTADGQKSLVLKSLKEWEERLPEKYFARIHRSTIINLEYVERVESWFNRSYRIYLRNIAEPFVMSRRYAARLKLRFG